MPDRFTPLLFPEMEDTAAPEPKRLPDAEARAAALDVRRSFVVEAPAGSGKTGLLIQRYLKLLSDEAVLEPEQVLAITYTNKAAGEMRDRVLEQLEKARQRASARSEFEQVSRRLASAVLERDQRLGWGLLEQPFRLNLRTVDSVCAQIARDLPVLSGSAGNLRPTEDASPLFAEAARRTLLLLGEGDGDASLAAALKQLLLHRDASLPDCEQLIAEMLSVRDQWGMLIPLDAAGLTDDFLDATVLPRLQWTLEDAICADLRRIAEIFPMDLLVEVAELAAEFGHAPAVKADVSPLSPCAGKRDAPQAIAADRDRWLALVHLLITKGGEWRKERGLTGGNLAFDYDRKHPSHRRMTSVLERLQGVEGLNEELCRVALLPEPVYPAAQWEMAKSLFRVLRRALVELQIVFAERGACDFTEVSLLARSALGSIGAGEETTSAGTAPLGASLQHLLVDEMQDTSTGQYELIRLLTKTWDGVSQTMFLVGDPRQSIYLFRQARVEHFIRTLDTCRLGDLELGRLRLTANFRSQRRLVEQFNEDFERIFDPAAEAEYAGDVLPYQRAQAVLGDTADSGGRQWHARAVTVPRAGDGDSEVKAPALRQRQARRNAKTIREIARHWIAKPLPYGRTEPWRIAVLVRNRRHLTEVLSEFQKTDAPAGRIPYRATEIEPLSERQEILDLLALTRALLHPADRVAGLALLRTPWCGLSLADLHRLAGGDEPEFRNWALMRLLETRGELLTADGCSRIERLWKVLEAAHKGRASGSPAQLVERAWRSLGGDAALKSDELVNARRYFELLDQVEASTGTAPSAAELDRRLQRLYAEPQTFGPDQAHVELLTMHRAKGLEWDVVILPALERWPGRNRPRLLTWAKLASSGPDGGAGSGMMLAPIAARGEEVDGLTRWLKRKYAEQEAAERKRLFYVAATRAREELHLFASPDCKDTGEVKPAPQSLLRSAWSAAEPHFAKASNLRGTATAGLGSVPGQRVELAAAASIVAMPRRDKDAEDDALEVIKVSPDIAPEATEEPLYSKPMRPEIVRLPVSFSIEERFAQARLLRLQYRRDEVAPREDHRNRTEGFLGPEGSLAARALGNVIHTVLELVANRVEGGETLDAIAGEIAGWSPRVAALLRADGLSPVEVARLTQEALASVRKMLGDSDGRWVLEFHPEAKNEYGLVGPHTEATALEAIRVDRTFLAAAEPQRTGREYLWVVDYKAASHGSTGLGDFLNAQRLVYAPQLENYARVLARHRGWGLDRVRVGLYYPAVPRLIWWAPGPG